VHERFELEAPRAHAPDESTLAATGLRCSLTTLPEGDFLANNPLSHPSVLASCF